MANHLSLRVLSYNIKQTIIQSPNDFFIGAFFYQVCQSIALLSECGKEVHSKVKKSPLKDSNKKV